MKIYFISNIEKIIPSDQNYFIQIHDIDISNFLTSYHVLGVSNKQIMDKYALKHIHNFIDKIPEKAKQDSSLIIYCDVMKTNNKTFAYCLNKYLNVSNPSDFNFFMNSFKSCRLNENLKKLFMDEFSGNAEYENEKIFSNGLFRE